MVTVKQHAQFFEVLLQPNRSATWVQTRQMIMALSGFMLAIGIGWLIMGVWMILPFVLIDIAVFSYLFYRVCKYTYQRQIINIYNDQILCQRGIHALSKPQQLSRPCYLVCEKRVSKQHLPAYSLSDDHHTVSIGDFLNKHDLKKLYSTLVDHGLFPIDKQWWQQTESP